MTKSNKLRRVFDRLKRLVGYLSEPVMASSFYGELRKQPRISFWIDELFFYTAGPYIAGITIVLLAGALIFGNERIEPTENVGQAGVIPTTKLTFTGEKL